MQRGRTDRVRIIGFVLAWIGACLVLTAMALDGATRFFNPAGAFLITVIVTFTVAVVACVAVNRWRRYVGVASALLACGSASFVAADVLFSAQLERAEQRGDALADRLDRWYDEHRSYPESLFELDGTAPIPTGIGLLNEIPFSYGIEDDGGYSLGYPSIPFFICRRGPTAAWHCSE